jgi:hypothetical protein
VVGAIFFALVAAVTLNGAVVIYRDTFRAATVASPYRSCSEGIRALHAAYERALRTTVHSDGTAVPTRPSAEPAVQATLSRLDEQLRALRPRCADEGRAADEAYEALTLWRFRAEDLSRVDERVLTPDAERALRYQSPTDTASSPPSGTPP